MILEFQSIKEMAVFKDFSWKNCLKMPNGSIYNFEKINIIYGRNYSGKTTLSRIIRAFETGELSDKYTNPKFTLLLSENKTLNETNFQKLPIICRVFNEDFVRDNLRFVNSDNDNIIPFAVVGGNNAKLEEEIENLKAILGSNEEGKESGLYLKHKNALVIESDAKKQYEAAKEDLETKKRKEATDRNYGIKYHSDRFGNQNYNITNLEEDIKIVTGATFSNISNEECKDLETILQESIKNAPKEILTLEPKHEELQKRTNEICQRKIGDSEKIKELLNDMALNEWVHQGLAFNKEREVCAFCGQPLTDSRWKILFKHFDKDSEKIQTDITNLENEIKSENEIFKNAFVVDKNEFYFQFINDVEKLLTQYTIAYQNYSKQLQFLLQLLEKKKNCITQSFEIDNIDFDKTIITSIFSQYKLLREQSINYASQIDLKKKEAQKKLRLFEVASFVSKTNYEQLIKKICQLKTEKEAAEAELQLIQDDIQCQKQMIESRKKLQKNEEKGVILVNKYLKNYFGNQNLMLSPVVEEIEPGKKQVHFEVNRNGSKAYNLSEGERSLIAFCYFVAKLDDSDTYDKKPIIWIDDPISSLDGNHIYFVYSLLQNEILKNRNYEQVFITTHNLVFLKYLRNIEKSNNGSHYYQIERKGDESSIIKMPNYLRNHGTEFNYWFEKIYLVAKATEINDNNFYLFETFGNNLRKFFETYLFYKFPNSQMKDKEKLACLLGDDVVASTLIGKLYDEQSHAQGDLENHEVVFDVPEILTSAKFIIHKLEEIDKTQFDSLVSSIEEK